jgi:hypothetical protein
MNDPRTIIAIAGEDDRYASLREVAIERARQEHATLILYDLDAPTSPLESPLPTEWSAEGTEEEVTDRLGPDELEAAGRAELAGQVRAAREAGVDAWGWLPGDSGREGLVSYASEQPSALLLVPDDLPDLKVDDLPEAEVVHDRPDPRLQA